MALDLVTLNQLPFREFVSVTGPLFEHSPWIAERAASLRPFASIGDFYAQLIVIVARADVGDQLSLIRAHPDLAGKLAIAGELTDHSRLEQKSARLDQLTPEQFRLMTALNDEYRTKFDFPFVICVRDHTQDGIFESFRRRVANERSAEMTEALRQIGRIAWHRLQALVAAKPVQLSTHVLDVSAGRPAAGVRLSLWRCEEGEWRPLRETTTNADGRTDVPLLVQSELLPGRYELRFRIGEYFLARGVTAGSPSFLDEIPVRFGISSSNEPIHVPLLVTPWGYSTYRGS